MTEFMCGFGSPSCGPEDIAGWVGIIIAIMAVGAAFAVALQNIRASTYGRPVLAAQAARITELEKQNAVQTREMDAQSMEISNLRELVTQAAKVDGFYSESRAWREASQREHEAQTATLERIAEHLQRTSASQAITARTILSIAKKLEVRVRDSDIGGAA